MYLKTENLKFTNYDEVKKWRKWNLH
jgi:hypothetical protein